MTNLLNDNQRRVLLVALRQCESSLRQAAAQLDTSPAPAILTRYTLGLSPEQRSEVAALANDGIERVGQLAARFALAPVDLDLSRSMAAAMTTNWANLSEVNTRRLAGYGPVHPQLSQALDADVEDLAALMLRIAETLSPNSGGRQRLAARGTDSSASQGSAEP